MTPKFTHDCTHCKFAGTVAGLDIYSCTSRLAHTTYIARSSSEGGDYASRADFKGAMRKTVAKEIGGLTDAQLVILTTFRLLPCLLLNLVERAE